MDEYMICDSLAEAVEVIETTLRAHCDIGDMPEDFSAQLAYYETEEEEAIGIIALVDGTPWDKLPLIYVPVANLKKTDKKSIKGWMQFSAPTEEGEMTCIREAGDEDD